MRLSSVFKGRNGVALTLEAETPSRSQKKQAREIEMRADTDVCMTKMDVEQPQST
jgi:hypothetical protein